MNGKRIHEIDGNAFSTLEGFFEEVSRKVIPGFEWGKNLDAFNDILRGGFGTPEEGFIIQWKNSAVSRERLGYSETVRQLELGLARCHPSNGIAVATDLDIARKGKGSTVFDWLVEIIERHCVGGDESEDGVELELE
jgi:RNAse (barnase) inhibitor barstar